ncbi:hypothetical protein C6P96_19550 [Burkholderia multivorans]|nr:hypothetical protein C6P96_19550 [Burkholderia multivorans]
MLIACVSPVEAGQVPVAGLRCKRRAISASRVEVRRQRAGVAMVRDVRRARRRYSTREDMRVSKVLITLSADEMNEREQRC